MRRQSGRTTRMLKEAVSLARQRRAVYVVAATNAECERIEALLPDNLGIKVATADSLRLDWNTLRLPGAHPNCVVLVDHYALETRFRNVLQELHRYDAKE